MVREHRETVEELTIRVAIALTQRHARLFPIAGKEADYATAARNREAAIQYRLGTAKQLRDSYQLNICGNLLRL
jgi:hypothetical protein